MCVFVSRPMKIVTFLLKNAYLPKRVVDFPRERDTFRNRTVEIVEDFACEAIFFHFLSCCVEGLYPTPHIYEQMTAYITAYIMATSTTTLSTTR